MTIGTVTYEGVEIGIEVVGTSKVQNINGAWEMHLSLAPVLPRGPGGPGDPLPMPRAA